MTFFYHHTLHHSSGITHAVVGNFLHEKKEDIIVSTGRILKLLRFEPNNKVVQTLISEDTYDVICSLSKFRRKDQTKDWFVFTTDSGNATMLAVDAEKMSFELVLQEEFKSKILRTLAIQHSSADSQGRAVCLAAVESLKQLWFFTDPDRKLLEILDVSEENLLIYDIAFVDINSENLVIAYLATVYEEYHAGVKYDIKERQKPSLIFCDGNLNKFTEIKRIKCLNYANSLISVPGEKGVLVCAEDFIAFYSMDSSDIIRCSIPKRIIGGKAGVIFVCSTGYDEKMNPNQKYESSEAVPSNVKKSIYYLAQTEQGDIFKIQLVSNDSGVNEIILKYFVTLPVASALCILESGFLFVASEFGDHHFYKIADIENRTRILPSFSSSLALPKGRFFCPSKPFLFMDRPVNITPVAEIKSMSPIMKMEFASFSSNRPQMFLATGRASLSAFKISALQQNVSNAFRVKIDKEKHEIPLRMWRIQSTKSIIAEENPETLIVVSFENSTAVYSLIAVSEYVIKKKEGTPFATHISTIGCAKTGEDAIVQICPRGIRLITDGENKLIHETAERNAIQNYAMNKKSLVVAYQNKLIMHHEIGENGHVKEPKIPRRLLKGPIICMHLSDSSANDELLAVGISIPASSASSIKSSATVKEVHLFNVTVKELQILCFLKVENSPYSFLFMNAELNQELWVGCEDGTLLTLNIQGETSKQTELIPMKSEIIGSEAVQLLLAPAKENLCVLAVSNHSWVKEIPNGDFIRLKSDFAHCVCILPERLPVGIATILEDSLRIFLLEDLRSKPPVTIPLEYTPKQFIVDSSIENIFIIEADDNSYTAITRKKKENELYEHVIAAEQNQPASNLPSVENIPRSWASIFRIISLSGGKGSKSFKLPLSQNEAALSLLHLGDNILLVGVAKEFNLSSACCTEASIHTYKIVVGNVMNLLHKMHVKSAPLAMCHFHGNVLIGTGRKLALYYLIPDPFDWKLLCEKKDCVSTSITAINTVGNRIYVNDLKFGVSCLVYNPEEASLHLLDKDIASAEVTASCNLNVDQMARATKSRDIFIVELGTIEDRNNSEVYNEREPRFTLSKEKLLACFHVGEVVTSLQPFSIFPNEPQAVVYTTLSGSVGILILLPWEKDANFLKSLNMALLEIVKEIEKKQLKLRLSQHSQLRSRHFKCENVIDGDFVGLFHNLKAEHQLAVSFVMEEDVTQISAKLASLRRETTDFLDFQF